MPTSSLKSQGLSPCSVIQESTAGTAGLTDAFYLGIIKKKTFSTRVRTNYLRVLWGKKIIPKASVSPARWLIQVPQQFQPQIKGGTPGFSDGCTISAEMGEPRPAGRGPLSAACVLGTACE